MTLLCPTLWFAGGLALIVSGVRADTTTATPKNPAPAVLSPRLKTAVRQLLPAYAPPPPRAPEASPTPLISRTPPISEDVVKLPDFRVQVRALPNRSRPKDGELLQHYLGSAHGLDRGVFNRIVLRWETNIATFAIDGAQSNESRAQTAYYDDLRVQQRVRLTDLAEVVKLSGDAESAAWIRRESDAAFMRRSPPLRRR